MSQHNLFDFLDFGFAWDVYCCESRVFCRQPQQRSALFSPSLNTGRPSIFGGGRIFALTPFCEVRYNL